MAGGGLRIRPLDYLDPKDVDAITFDKETWCEWHEDRARMSEPRTFAGLGSALAHRSGATLQVGEVWRLFRWRLRNREQQAAEFGAVFQLHAHGFETGLAGAHEAHHRLQIDAAQPNRYFQVGVGAG